jgi:hypothetical protein
MSPSGPPERASLASALEEEQARLRRLEAERAGAKARADALRAQLAALGEAPVVPAEPKDDLFVEYDDDVLRVLDHESATDQDDDFAEWVP